MFHVSRFICQVSHFTCHLSHVKKKFLRLFFYLKKEYSKEIGQHGGAGWLRVCYQPGLPHLYFVFFNIMKLLMDVGFQFIWYFDFLLKHKKLQNILLLLFFLFLFLNICRKMNNFFRICKPLFLVSVLRNARQGCDSK